LLALDVIQQRKELLGLTVYLQLIQAYKRELKPLLKALEKKEGRPFALHSLKSMSFSVGLDDIGRHVQHIEQTLINGAELTAQGYIKRLEIRIHESLDELEALLG
jgi:HPt (histidine-containing phosphotransfer) domain-containing protein